MSTSSQRIQDSAGYLSLNALRRSLAFCGNVSLAIVGEKGEILEWDDHAGIAGDPAQVVGQPYNAWMEARLVTEQLVAEPVQGGDTGRRAVLIRRAGSPPQTPPDASAEMAALLLPHAERLSDLGCFAWDIRANKVHWSDGLYRIYGLEPQQFEATLEGFLERVLPEDRPQVQQAVQAALQQCGSFESVERIRHTSGETRVLESCGQVLTNASGEPTHLIGVCRDVTRRTAYQKSLAWQIEGLKLLATSASELMAPRDGCGGGSIYKRLAAHLECEALAVHRFADDRLQLELAEGLPSRAREQLQNLRQGELLCGICAERREMLYLAGDQMQHEPRAAVFQDAGLRTFASVPLIYENQLLGVLSFASASRWALNPSELDFVQTIGQIVAAAKSHRILEDQKLRAEETSRRILKQARMVTWEAEPDTLNFTFLNGSCEELLGFPEAQWMAPGFWRERLHVEHAQTALVQLQQATPENRRFEYRMLHADGYEVWVEVNVEAVHDAATGTLARLRGVLSDITVRKRLEDQLLYSQKMEAVGRLAGGVAHDFNNLLTVITTYAELLAMTSEAREITEPAMAIQDAVERASDLTAKLLMFGRNLSHHDQIVNLNEIVAGSQSLLEGLLGKQIELETQLQPDLANIKADKSHLDQVLVNLCANARDAMPAGGRLTIATARHDVRLGDPLANQVGVGQYVRLDFCDSGHGMPDDVRAMAFEPFFTTKPFGQGTGLGLAVVYGVVREAGGTIAIESEVGKGTTFRILFPATTKGVTQEPEVLPASPQRSQLVVVVDDEEPVRCVAAATLRRGGYRVAEADCAEQAMAIIDNLRGDVALLLTDIVMPGKSGLHLADAVRKRYPHVQILCVSGYSNNALKHRDTPHAFLQKPFTASTLLERVRGLLSASSQAGAGGPS